MNENDLIKVLQELKVYSQTWKTICTQNFSCQTDFQESDINNNIPFIYCSQYPIDGHVETQCNIPLSQVHCKKCENAFPVEDAATQCDFPLIRKECSKAEASQRYSRHIKREKDDDFLSVQDPYSLGLSESSHGTEKTLDYSTQQNLVVGPLKSEVDVSETSKITKAESKNVCIKKIFDPGSPRNEPDSCDQIESADYHQNEEAMDYDEPEDEIILREKFGLPETSEEDKRFWAEMKEKSKHIRTGSKNKRKKHSISSASVKKKNSGNELQKESNIGRAVKDRCSMESEYSDDWITDDEDDDEATEDFNLIFKDEWRKKRVPAHTHEKNYVCDVCNKPYSKSHYLRDHIVRDHSDHAKAKEFPFQCHHCKRVYNGQKQLDYHQSLHNGPCEICGMMFGCSGLFWSHRKNHDAVCDICKKSFSSLSSLSTHKKMKHERKRFFCNICDKGFIYQSLLKMHTEKSHSWRTDEKNASGRDGSGQVDLNCEECNYVAKNEQSLKVHQGMAHRRKRKKSEDKVYCCPICNAELTTKAILKKHVSKHLGPFPTFKCSVCNKLYATGKKLESHRRKVHGLIDNKEETQELHLIAADQEVYPCKSCGSSFVTTYALEDHMTSVHGISQKIKDIDQAHIVYECAYCSSSFESTNTLQTHILSVHGVSHTVSREVVQVATDQLRGPGTVEEYPVMEINLSERTPGSPERRVVSETFEIKVETAPANFDTRTTVSLPACAVPADVSMVEIDGVKYHVIRNGQ